MNPLSKILAILLLASLAPTPCAATPRAVIFIEGEKPSRVVFAAEFLDLQDRTDRASLLMHGQSGGDWQQQQKVAMRVIAIYEDPGAPESTDMTVEFMCFQQRFRITSAHTMLRDGSERFPTQDWQSYGAASSAWPLVASEIACKNEIVRKAVDQVATSQGQQDFRALEKLGIFYIGEPDRLETVDRVWQTFLSDGKRPDYAARKLSDAEVAGYLAKIDENLKNLKKSNEAAMEIANVELRRMKDEREFKKEIATNGAKHGKQLGWLLGQSEQAIVRVAGRPFDLLEDGDTRYLIYYDEYAKGGVGYVRDTNRNYIGTSTTVTCEVRIEMRRGGSSDEYRAVDYRLIADNGGCRDLSWFRK